MDAWENLLIYSTAPEGSDAWTHLLNQEGGGSGTVDYIVLSDGLSLLLQPEERFDILIDIPAELDTLVEVQEIEALVEVQEPDPDPPLRTYGE